MSVALNRPGSARLAGLALGAAIGLFLVYWIGFAAPSSIANNWQTFVKTTLDGLTAGGLYFIVASGFTLIFGLMRVVNMAHGSIYLIGGYIAIDFQRTWITGSTEGALSPDQVSLFNWVAPALLAALIVAVISVIAQQLLLRWNQGQDLRQALITIALSYIAADQVTGRFGGISQQLAFPDLLNTFVSLRIGGIDYSVERLAILGIATVVGVVLWIWLKRTRTGMVIRAGVDDRSMVSALGVNVQRTFAIAFFVGAFLAGLGGGIGASQNSAAPGVDGNWLLNSLVVVIIGGMGSLGGAALGSILYGLVGAFAPTYLPYDYSQYSIIFTFILLALALAFKPYGLFGGRASA